MIIDAGYDSDTAWTALGQTFIADRAGISGKAMLASAFAKDR